MSLHDDKPLHELKLLVYGEKGIGITSFVNSLVGAKGAVIDCKRMSWERIRGAVTLVVEKANKGEVVVLEGIEEAYQSMRDHVLNANGWRAETDGAYGLGKKVVGNEWASFIRLLLKGGGFVLTAHSRQSEVATLTRSYTKTEPNISPSALDAVVPHLDGILLAEYETDSQSGVTERVIHTSGREDRAASGGLESILLFAPAFMEYIKKEHTKHA